MFPRRKSTLMTFWKHCLAVGALFSAVLAPGATLRPPEAPREASVHLASRSIRFGQGTSQSDLSVVFSTAGAGPRFLGNGELRPSVTRPGFYEAGYAIMDSSSGTPRRVEAGTMFVAMPENDHDDDTVPDTADLSAMVDLFLMAEAVPNAASLATRLSRTNFFIHLRREGNSGLGEFAADLLPDDELTGDYEVLHAEGSVVYRRTDAGGLLDFFLSNAITNAPATARLTNAETIRTSAFRLRVSPSRRVGVAPATLTRVENLHAKRLRSVSVYRGEVTLSDGREETAVPDFRSWVMQIDDPNDQNENGVADFSDTLRPYLAVQPHRVITALGETVSFSVVVLGTGPFSFAWQQSGHDLSNPTADTTGRVLTLPSIVDGDLGSYRVYVSNAAGTVVSDSASLSLRQDVIFK